VVVAVDAGAASTSAIPATTIGMNLHILEPPGVCLSLSLRRAGHVRGF
jgi:hypothetical protein